MRNTELSNDILPDKPLDIHISNISQRFSFNPFGEIVYADQQILLLPITLEKGPTISKPHWPKGQGLERGLRTPSG